jgi:hypothetical protein
MPASRSAAVRPRWRSCAVLDRGPHGRTWLRHAGRHQTDRVAALRHRVALTPDALLGRINDLLTEVLESVAAPRL